MMDGQLLREMPLRRALVEAAQRMNAEGINRGTSGNLSVRLDENVFLITPSGVPYDELVPEKLPALTTSSGAWLGGQPPSSEWRMHQAILVTRPDVQAIVHAHPVHASALACLRREIPAFHYMVAAAGGSSIRCAGYATYGSSELAGAVLTVLENRKACLMANHGIVAVGASLQEALALAVNVEMLANVYVNCLKIGEPALLSEEEMAAVLEKFKTYGQRPAVEPAPENV